MMNDNNKKEEIHIPFKYSAAYQSHLRKGDPAFIQFDKKKNSMSQEAVNREVPSLFANEDKNAGNDGDANVGGTTSGGAVTPGATNASIDNQEIGDGNSDIENALKGDNSGENGNATMSVLFPELNTTDEEKEQVRKMFYGE